MLWYYAATIELVSAPVPDTMKAMNKRLPPPSRVPPQPIQKPSRHGRTSELFEKAFQNSPAMQSIVRFSDAVLVEVNERFTKTLGYRRDEVIGKTPFELNFWVAPEKLHLYRGQLETKGFV